MLVDFVATSASSVMAQATPAIVQVTNNALAQTSNSSIISVIVRDVANNLVKNARINFTITTDPTGGSLSAATAITDINGSASVTYTAGAISSAQNGVAITATVVDVGGVATVAPQPTSIVNLTVSGQTLFVRLGTDNLLAASPPTNLSKTWVAIVTDAGGNPMVGVPVRFTLRPSQYEKGFYVPAVAPATGWSQRVTAICANEDLNFNGILDPGEDTNLNGRLDPGGVASVTASAITDASGIASAFIVYPKNYATWTGVTLEARAGVIGNDPPSTAYYGLAGIITDYTSPASPPGATSPFGTAAICTNPN